MLFRSGSSLLANFAVIALLLRMSDDNARGPARPSPATGSGP